jgi:hypothetical protein
MVEFSEKVRSAGAREALTAFFEKRPPHFNTGELHSQGSLSLK